MKKLSAEILGQTWQPTIREVDWHGYVGEPMQAWVREMSSLENDQFETDAKKDTRNLRARFLTLVLCDKSGTRIFQSNQAGELGRALGTRMARHIFEQGMVLNGFKDEDFEEMEKNSEATEGDSSATS